MVCGPGVLSGDFLHPGDGVHLLSAVRQVQGGDDWRKQLPVLGSQGVQKPKLREQGWLVAIAKRIEINYSMQEKEMTSDIQPRDVFLLSPLASQETKAWRIRVVGHSRGVIRDSQIRPYLRHVHLNNDLL
jgi:hypothetical protein